MSVSGKYSTVIVLIRELTPCCSQQVIHTTNSHQSSVGTYIVIVINVIVIFVDGISSRIYREAEDKEST
ncbi:hypothetical protein P167DRAFT_537957 [Morchella conica CCBAS932]|uniref:Uncharacterized protein n=1 Tax=Morchella conica CCBAS932 TaxID=1392247 RepID=A0A3N4KHK7_9PEZI|nr:hypothetical protein P167DRAFT_537957 [Morchella conica CCBAS932]